MCLYVSLCVFMWLDIARYQCNFEGCEQSFPGQPDLTAHVVEHVGQKPFLCAKCGATFVSRGNVNKHTKKVHQEGKALKRFPCEEENCQDEFNTAFQLEQHKRLVVTETTQQSRLNWSSTRG